MKRTMIAISIIIFMLFPIIAGNASVSVSKSLTLESNHLYVIAFDANKGDSLVLNYTVSKGGPVDFIVLNESNYNLYINGWIDKNQASFSYWGQMSAINTTKAFLNFTITISQMYFLVIENSDYFANGANTIGPVTVIVNIHTVSSTPGFEFDSIFILFTVPIAFSLFRKYKNRKMKR